VRPVDGDAVMAFVLVMFVLACVIAIRLLA